MAFIQDGRSLVGFGAIENQTRSMRVTNAPRGRGFAFSATTGTIATGQAAGGAYIGIRNSPTATYNMFIEKVRLQFTAITAFTTPVTAGRRLSLWRGSGAATTGGTALVPMQKDTTSIISQAHSSNGGDARAATTASLGITTIVWDAQPIREVALSHVGALGANVEDQYDFTVTAPLVLQPGQLFAIRNPQAMDAGTWQISVDIDWSESVPWGSTTAD